MFLKLTTFKKKSSGNNILLSIFICAFLFWNDLTQKEAVVSFVIPSFYSFMYLIQFSNTLVIWLILYYINFTV